MRRNDKYRNANGGTDPYTAATATIFGGMGKIAGLFTSKKDAAQLYLKGRCGRRPIFKNKLVEWETCVTRAAADFSSRNNQTITNVIQGQQNKEVTQIIAIAGVSALLIVGTIYAITKARN